MQIATAAAVSTEERHPSFALALIAVFAAGAVASWCSMLFVGFSLYLARDAWFVLNGLVGAWAVKTVLRVLGYHLGYFVAAAAMLVGAVLSAALLHALPRVGAGPALPLLPGFGLVAGVPSLLLTTWIVQLSAARPPQEKPV
jgi:hypothetical protein